MTETFSPFDAANYLATDEDVAAYLEAAEATNDPHTLLMALGTVARARNMSQLSREAGLTREGVYKALSGSGNPSFATVAKIAGALGYQISLIRSGPKANDARIDEQRA